MPAEDLKMNEIQTQDVYKILLGCGDCFDNKPRQDPTSPTARQQLQGIMTQPLAMRVDYKRKSFKGKSYRHCYA